jgi:hypothetical protein
MQQRRPPMISDLAVGLVRADRVLIHPNNVRNDLVDLHSLADSTRQYGVMHPIVVEKYGLIPTSPPTTDPWRE